MSTLHLKMFRDLWGMKGQALAIAVVMAGGVATFVMSRTVLEALLLTQSTFYRDYQFADIFVSLKRAPNSMGARLADIPGVQTVETRVIASANVEVEGFGRPASAEIVSVPDHGQPLLNRLYLKRGRLVDSTKDNEVIISEAFAIAHKLEPGGHVLATINGRRRRLAIVGVAVTPEYIYQVQPGALIPDFATFGIFWMARRPLEAAFDMDGAFNNAVMRLGQGANEEDVIDSVDRLLRRYGSLGAYGRKDQTSHRYLSEEFKQLRQMGFMFPLIFLSVAAFLLNVVVTRLVATQREQIAILKAFGYSTAAIVWHYISLILMVTAVGACIGIGVGTWMGSGMASMYMTFYRFPYMLFSLQPKVALAASLICAAAAVAGAIHAVTATAKLPPAEAMQPDPPAHYRVSIVERLGIRSLLSQPSRMIVRNLERQPVKSAFSVLGVAFACAILVTGQFFQDAMNYMVNMQFRVAQLDDMTVTFNNPTSYEALYEIGAIPGVRYAEPFRAVPANLRYEHRSYRTSVRGIAPDAKLQRLLSRRQKEVRLPPEGIVLTDYLAKILKIQPGDLLTVEVLEGDRPVWQIPVTGVVNEWVGVYGYMQLPALNRMMREGHAISGVAFTVDEDRHAGVYAELKEAPRVAGTVVRLDVVRNFMETMANQALVFAFFNTILAASIAFGVVYNSARIALSERSRELASLRVLGYTRGEISFILLGELTVITLAGIPLGFSLGKVLSAWFVSGVQSDLYRIPIIVNDSTYAVAASVVLISAVISGLIVRRKLDHLDLVAVLKTKE
ncbi:MAG: FtsX-like permease family protein [Bryobacterales bacterium]|nr:FtsX-like permease family protein [Bryobacterales bacterium]